MSNNNYRVGGRGKHYVGNHGRTLNKFVSNALVLTGPGRYKNSFNVTGGNIRSFNSGIYNKASIHLKNNNHAKALIRSMYKKQGLNIPSVLPVGIVKNKGGQGFMLISSKMFGIKNTNGIFVIKVGRMGLANYAKLYNHVNKLVKSRRS